MRRMTARREQDSFDNLLDTVRSNDLVTGLMSLGEFATGRSGFLVNCGHCLRGKGRTDDCVDMFGASVKGIVEVTRDRALDSLGLEWAHGAGQQPLGRRAAVSVIVLRAGILAKMLDRAYNHLAGRESDGRKTLQHQLVKAAFVESHGMIERIRHEARSLLNDEAVIDLARVHGDVSRLTGQASKLMGGHGYLLGELNSLEIASLCVTTIYGETAAAGTRSDQQGSVGAPEQCLA